MTRPIRFAIGLGILLVVPGAARAAIPSEFTVQGVLRDNAGKLESQMVMVTISFFDAQTNGNALGLTHGPTAVMAANGLFTQTVTLGAAEVTAIGGASSAFLQMQVDSDTFPRQKVEPEMYALLCENATKLGGVDASGYLTTTGVAADSAKLGGVAASGYLTTTGTAANSSQLGGVPASGYLTATATAADSAKLGGVAAASYLTSAAANATYLKSAVTNIATGAGLTGGPISSTGTIQIANGGVTDNMVASSTLTLAKLASRSGGDIPHVAPNGQWVGSPITYNNGANSLLVSGSSVAAQEVCASCPGNTVVVSGSCSVTAPGANLGTLPLVGSRSAGTTQWCCAYYNNGNPTPGSNWFFNAWANCL